MVIVLPRLLAGTIHSPIGVRIDLGAVYGLRGEQVLPIVTWRGRRLAYNVCMNRLEDVAASLVFRRLFCRTSSRSNKPRPLLRMYEDI